MRKLICTTLFFSCLAVLLSSYQVSRDVETSSILGPTIESVLESRNSLESLTGFDNSTVLIKSNETLAYGNDTANQQFVNFSINGTAVSIDPAISGKVIQSPDEMYPNSVLIEATGGINAADLYFRFNNENVSVGGSKNLYHVMNGVIGLPVIPTSPILVHITEYGSIGEYISGNFSGTVHDFNTPNVSYAITCEFRVLRQL